MVTPVDVLLNNSVTGGDFFADCASQPVCQDSGWGGGEGGSPFPRAFGPIQTCCREIDLEKRKDALEKCAGASRLASREILREAGVYIPPGNREASALRGYSAVAGVRGKCLNQGS